MGDNDAADVQKLEQYLISLKDEFTKLQCSYSVLERKYYEIIATSNEDSSGELYNFDSRLSLTVSSLYGHDTYSDINIRTQSKLFPAHKIVLHARSEKLRADVLDKVQELDWSDLKEDVILALLRWIYTDLIDFHYDGLALDVLKASHRFGLPALLRLCEQTLITTVGIRSCVRFYCVAEEVSATTLLEYCSGLISTHWDDLETQDFEHMSGPLLYKMLKNKTKYPLHEAVRLLREDVVFLCIKENNSALPKLINSFSENGLLPLQMALSAKNFQIAQTLVQHGSANINAVDIEGYTLLASALKSGDAFSANFLLDQNCLLDLSSGPSADTALHIICSYCECRNNQNIFGNILQIGLKMLQKDSNVNIQNKNGETPLHIAITTKNTEMIKFLLQVPKININLRTLEEKCALELSLTFQDNTFELASTLLKMGAEPNPIKSATGNSLLQVFAMDKERENAAIFLTDFAKLNYLNMSGLTALHIATFFNKPNLVKKLVTKGASCNIQSIQNDLKSPIHMAIESDALESLEALVQMKGRVHKDDFNSIDINGDSPLSLCLGLKRTRLVSTLIRGGANVNAKNKDNITLLHQAIINEDSETSLFLLEQGADFTARTGDPDSILILSIEKNLPTVVDSLCTKGVSLNSSDNNGVSPLWTALVLERKDVAHVLVRHGVDTDCWHKGPYGCQQTLLHRAIDENKDSIAIFLIQSHCDLDSARQAGPNGEGKDEVQEKASPSHLCCQWGLTLVLQTLIDHGANINAVDDKKKTPLHIAIENQHEEIITILLCHPLLDLKLRDMFGNTAFASALETRNHKAAQRILERLPTAAEQMDQRGRNFLHLAIMKDDLESVLFLLSIQVDVNSRVHDVNQSTPLHLSAASEIEMITRNLILAGARMNECDALQKLPLHIAIEHGNLSAVSALIQNGADYDATDADGNNALHLAVHGGQFLIVRELLTESRVNAEARNIRGRNPMHELCRVVEDNTAATICELFLECMPKYPINIPDLDGNTPLLLSFMRGQSPLCKVLVKAGACLGTENREGINIFNFKLATDQLLHNLLDKLTQESPWSESDLCQECTIKFTITMRKHHCRHCGRVLCSKCSSNDIPILKFGINKPVRVCSICFNVLQCGNVIV